jgi:AcrR family transcriptional regulator/DNA-binding MarR family transcriptional regulator
VRTVTRQRSVGSRARNGRVVRAGSRAVGVEQIAGVQRARLLSAMVDVACERGAGSTSVVHVVQRSGVSRRTFYELFDGWEDCFLASFEQALGFATERVLESHDQQGAWRERVRNGLVAFLSFLDEQPRLGRVLLVESLAGGPRVTQRRAEAIGELTRLIDEGAAENKVLSSRSALISEGVVGAVLSILSNRLTNPVTNVTNPAANGVVTSDRQPLLALTKELASMIVLPYLGPAAARRELERPVPVARPVLPEGEPLLSDPFKDAGMRLTYRTVRVLLAVAEHPGGSNRQIGETAELTDQGQISKLLARLQRLGMLTNTGVGPSKGAPNAWMLTPTGTRIVTSIHAHTDSQSNRNERSTTTIQRQQERRRRATGRPQQQGEK